MMKHFESPNTSCFVLALLILQSLLISQKTIASSSLVKLEQGVTKKETLEFWTGFSLFRSPWVASPSSTTGRDGLGPLFNARACSACHKNGGHGKLPIDGPGLIARLGVYNAEKKDITPLEYYGSQLQTLSIKSMVNKNTLPAEATLKLNWKTQIVKYGNNTLTLKKPIPQIKFLAYGKFPQNTRISLRLAPPLFGLGLLEQIPEYVLKNQTDEKDSDKNGISGKTAKVWSIEHNQWTVGRFGYKAEQPTLLQQNAAAFHSDIGISNWLYPTQNCAEKQIACMQTITGNSKKEAVEISREKLKLTTLFTQKLKHPTTSVLNEKNTKIAQKGRNIFESIGCVSCHTASYTLANNKTISPYSDLLLHDMGEGLSDNKPINNASAREWRTTPLWGIRHKLNREAINLLHDGRASSIEEAIGWHGGEAKKSALRYFKLSTKNRQNINLFISHL